MHFYMVSYNRFLLVSAFYGFVVSHLTWCNTRQDAITYIIYSSNDNDNNSNKNINNNNNNNNDNNNNNNNSNDNNSNADDGGENN